MLQYRYHYDRGYLLCIDFQYKTLTMMDKYLVNYTPPAPPPPVAPKRKSQAKSAAEAATKSKTYELEGRDREYQKSWKQKWDWLAYHVVNGEGKMYLMICRQFETSGTLVTECYNFRIDTVRSHDGSKPHKANVTRRRVKIQGGGEHQNAPFNALTRGVVTFHEG